MIFKILFFVFLNFHLSQGECPPEWTAYKEGCYKLNHVPSNWYSAQQSCEEINSNLVSITKLSEQKFLSDMIKNSNPGDAWLGLIRPCPKDSLRWTDGSSLSAVPSNLSKSILNECVTLDDSNKWTMRDCFETMPFVCKQNLTINVKPIDTSDRCGQGWKWCQHDAYCYYINYTMSANWNIAQKVCEMDNATLAIPELFEEPKFFTTELVNRLESWRRQGKSEKSPFFWIGITRTLKKFKPIEFLSGNMIHVKTVDLFRDSSDLDETTNYCVLMNITPINSSSSMDNKEYELMGERCSENFPFICKKFKSQVGIDDEIRFEEPCEDGWFRFENSCLKELGKHRDLNRANFTQAVNTCQSYGADLASIPNFYFNLFVLSLLEGAEHGWIGYIKIGQQRSWLDKAPITFEGFGNDEAYRTSVARFKDDDLCTAMSVSYFPSIWHEVVAINGLGNNLTINQSDSSQSRHKAHRESKVFKLPPSTKTCENWNINFICAKPWKKVVTRAPYATSYCPEKSNKYRRAYFSGQSCYVFYAKRLNQSMAEAECRSFKVNEYFRSGAHLVSIDDYHDYAVVSSMAYHLGFKKYWIGLKKKDNETLAWTDGGPLMFSYFPNNTFDRKNLDLNRCVSSHTLPDKANWFPTNCSDELPFVCKLSGGEKIKPIENHLIHGKCPNRNWLESYTQCYRVVRHNSSHDEASSMCQKINPKAQLASFPTKEDINRLLRYRVMTETVGLYHIGLRAIKYGIDDSSVWENGEPSNFTNWALYNPRHGDHGLYPCVSMDYLGQWLNFPCDQYQSFICSIEKTPFSNVSPAEDDEDHEWQPPEFIDKSSQIENDKKTGSIPIWVYCVGGLVIILALLLGILFAKKKLIGQRFQETPVRFQAVRTTE